MAGREVCTDKLKSLDKRISPGLHKLTWMAAKPSLDYYFKECSKYATSQFEPTAYSAHVIAPQKTFEMPPAGNSNSLKKIVS